MVFRLCQARLRRTCFSLVHPTLYRRVRRVFRAVRTKWAADPTIIQTAPRRTTSPVALCSAVPASALDGDAALLIGPVIALVALLALPFFSGKREKLEAPPIAVLTILLAAVALELHTSAGQAPWSPVMDAWSGEPIPAQYLKGRTP